MEWEPGLETQFKVGDRVIWYRAGGGHENGRIISVDDTTIPDHPIVMEVDKNPHIEEHSIERHYFPLRTVWLDLDNGQHE